MQNLLLIIFITLLPQPSLANQVTMLCHADPKYSEYNYGGVWEIDEDGQPICNFWKFLPEGQNHKPTQIIRKEEIQDNEIYSEAEDEPEFIEYDIEAEEE